MIVPIAFDWDNDGDLDLIVGDEDGRVAFIENVTDKKMLQEKPLLLFFRTQILSAASRYFEIRRSRHSRGF